MNDVLRGFTDEEWTEIQDYLPTVTLQTGARFEMDQELGVIVSVKDEIVITTAGQPEGMVFSKEQFDWIVGAVMAAEVAADEGE